MFDEPHETADFKTAILKTITQQKKESFFHNEIGNFNKPSQ